MGLAFSSFLLGLLATFNPCILPLYPAFLAYLGIQAGTGINRQRTYLGFFVLTGVLTMMIVLGALIAVLAISIGSLLTYLIPAADLVLLVMGVLLLLDRSPFKMLPVVQVPLLRHPLLSAYVYGLLYGPITLPCSGPLVVSIFTLSLTAGEALGKLAVFLCFGLGFGLPLLVLSLLSGGLQRQLTRLVARHSRLVNAIAGLLLVGIAIYDLALNWGMLRLFFFHRP